MWQSRRWVERAVGTAMLAMVSVPPVGYAEQPAGVSWSVIDDSHQSVERQAPTGIGQHVFRRPQARPSPAWLDLHGGRSRAANREPDLWRYEF